MAFIDIIKTTIMAWLDDGGPRLAAALAYYTIFALAPILIFVIAIAGLVLSQDVVRAEVLQQIESAVGPQSAELVDNLITNMSSSGSGLISTLLGIGALLFGALGVFNNLQVALDKMWDVSEDAQSGGVQGFIQDKLLSFGMLLLIGLLLLLSLVLSTVISSLSLAVTGTIPGSDILVRIANFAVSFAVITLLFALTFKYLPHAKIEWRDVWVGAGVTALLFSIGKLLLSLYLGRSTLASPYGTAGAIILILAWVYYSAQIVLVGAEFTQVYAHRYGSRIVTSSTGTQTNESAPNTPRREPISG